jgi:hypothetical protein
MDVVFATSEQQPLITPDDEVLAGQLRRRGVDVTPIPWTEIDPYAILDAPPILLRSTWDYHRNPTHFRTWLDALADSGRRTWNPAPVARRNIDKIYLQQLEGAGIAIPRTQWIAQPDNHSIAAAMREQGWPRAVLKPRIAATAYGTFIVDADPRLDEDALRPARASGALLQEVIPEVMENGEVSLVYFDGAFSHAVTKRARSGDFRVQKDFGGTVEVMTPAAALRGFADHVMAVAAEHCLYARVDVVAAARGPLLMELELIEPELYFGFVPEAADRLAAVLLDRLRG